MLTRCASALRSFGRDRAGGLMVTFGVVLFPIALTSGMAVDYGRLMLARGKAQSALDTAALAASRSSLETQPEMLKAATEFLKDNLGDTIAAGTKVLGLTYNATTNDLTLRANGSIDATFLGLIGYKTLDYSITSHTTKSILGSVEVALVLDNTWSMSGTKLTALKSAASNLVDTLTKDPSAKVKMSLVPFADYVNVGTSNRTKNWLSVPADYSVSNPGSCTTVTQKCVKGSPTKTCTRVVDTIPETYDCTPSVCTPVTPYQSCSNPSTTNYKWFGCVGSRTTGTLRLNDTQPLVTYPGYLATSQNCLNPIIPLTDKVSTVKTAINAMVVNVGGYKPETYIPAGLIWGVNVLSPDEPFAEAKPYDAKNKEPRKALVLMTDGANTLRFNAADGKHPTANATQLVQTNSDMVAICTYAKSKGIELYTVAFTISDTAALANLQSCSSGAGYYYNASDPSALYTAFAQIGASLATVRIAQ